MQDLQEVTHDLHYENYRATRLADGSDGEIAGAGNYFLNISKKLPRGPFWVSLLPSKGIYC